MTTLISTPITVISESDDIMVIEQPHTMRSMRVSETKFVTDAPLRFDDAQGVISGYVFIWGDAEHPDAYDTWFDRSRPPDIGGSVGDFNRPLSYEHNADGTIRIDRVGEIRRIAYDEYGLRFDAQLDRTSPYFPAILRDVRNGKLKTSSATAEHTAQFYADGAFRSWWLVEVALTENPAESRMPQVSLVRSAEVVHAESRADANANDVMPLIENTIPLKETRMTVQEVLDGLIAQGFTLEEIQAYLSTLAAPMEEAETEMSAPVAPSVPAMSMPAPQAPRSAPVVPSLDLQALTNALNIRRQSAPAPQAASRPATAPRSGEGVNANFIPDGNFSNLSAPDMWMIAKVMGDNEKPTSENFQRAMIEKTQSHLVGREALVASGQARGDKYAEMFTRAYRAKRANEIMATDIAGQGTEWVGVMYAKELWEAARVAPIYQSLLSGGMMERELEPGTASVYIPTEGADPTWYSAPQANDISSGRIEVTSNPQFVGTGRQLVTPGMLKATVAWSEELDEDSIIPMASWLNTQLQRSAQEVIEYAMVNGDTATGANVNLNLIDGTPGTGASRPAYLVTDGFMKLPIVTTTTLSYDAGNTMSEDLFLEVIKKFPNAFQANKQSKLRFILGVSEATAALNIPAVKTRDINTQATIENGTITNMWGVPVLVSGQIAKANTAGKISATPGNNLYGRILAIAPQYWAFVMSRQVKIKVSEDPYNDATLMRVSLRMGMQYRSTNAAAAAYEVAV